MGDQIKGIDYIAGVNYIDTIVKHHPKGWAAGFLVRVKHWKSGLKAVKALAETGLCLNMRIHGEWHDDHKFTDRDIPRAVKIAERVAKLAEQYPNIKFYYSPWLEPQASVKDMKACVRACKKVLPKRVTVVAGRTIPLTMGEVHHSLFAPCLRYIFSFDGLDMFKTPLIISYWKELHKEAKIFFAWTPRCNGYTNTATHPRNKRTDWLTGADIKRIVKAMGDN